MKIINHPLIILVITIFAILVIASQFRTAQRSGESAESITTLEKEIETQQQKVQELERLVNESQSDYSKEKILRDELLYKKPGEIIVQMPKPPVVEEPAVTIETSSPISEWLKLFFRTTG